MIFINTSIEYSNKGFFDCSKVFSKPLDQLKKFGNYFLEFHAYATAPLRSRVVKVLYQSGITTLACSALHFVGKSLEEEDYNPIVASPIIEEILFRFFLQNAIKTIQGELNKSRTFFFKTEFSETDIKAQRVFRVRLQAALFGLAHALNPHSHVIGKIIQVTRCAFSGLALGWLREKSHSIVPGIFLHAIGNAVVALSPKFTIPLAMKIFGGLASISHSALFIVCAPAGIVLAVSLVVTPIALLFFAEYKIHQAASTD